MQQRVTSAAFVALALLILGSERARAQCVLPYQLTNGQVADATQVMANYNALIACLTSAAPAGSNNALQYNAGSGTLGAVGPLTDGQLVIGSTGAAPQAHTLTPGSGIVITNGPGNITISTVPGGGSGLYGPVISGRPTAASTGLVNWLNQNGGTSTDSAVGLSINVPSSSGAVSGLFAAAPPTPYTITALIAATRNSNSFNGVGIGWYDGSSKLHLISYVTQGGNAPYFEIEKWDSFSSFNNKDMTSASNAFSQPIWLRIADDGANITFAFSQDGANFLPLFSSAKSSGFLGATGYSNIIFFANPINSRTIGTLMSWAQN
ncbi:hypothetical protein EDE08_11014 [Bradyrhizobium sp. R2.2-H]|uniref:hypothetical protein n=1 Tax=unclassified Bradyrhizobium TaxID=2631580 RepID=UPI001044350A|nr:MULTISPECIES: hypothetical protein [unclassified Bradyrhizobium]TCU67440.1 hypothetical protein EDE10_110265 [Bradyrhizobium sp. Y-H1]TCU68993.1 hypothetical protein EDE08_11014 [Bradyrhizobium sp. R2.2-H]